MKANLASGQGLRYSIFSGNKITQKDITSITNYANAMKNGVPHEQAAAKYLQKCTVAGKNYVTQANEAGKSTDEMVKGLKTVPKTASSASTGIRLLSTALNMLTNMAIMLAISKLIEAFDNIINSSEHCKERVDELMSSFKNALDTANANAKTIEEIADKYEKLSKGVNNLGQNVALTSDEFAEYNDMTNQIAEMFPELIKGWTDEGNAILSIKGNVEELRDAYKEARKEAYNLLIADGEDSDGNDIIEHWNNLTDGNWVDDLLALGKQTTSKKETLDILKKSVNTTYEEYRKRHRGATKADYQTYINELKSEISTLESEISTGLSNVRSLANAYLNINTDYEELNEDCANVASLIVNNLDAEIADQFENKSDVGTYVYSLVEAISSNTDVQKAISDLYELDLSDMPIRESISAINSYIKILANATGLKKSYLRDSLGFDIYYDTNRQYEAMLEDALNKDKSSSTSYYRLTGASNAESEEIINRINQFAEDYSINTQEEIAAFQRALIETEYDVDKAIERYIKSLEKIEEEKKLMSIFDINYSEKKDTIDKFQEKLSTLGDTYSKILEGDYSGTELIDMLQELSEAGADLSTVDSIDELNESILEINTDNIDNLINLLDIDPNSSLADYLKAISDEAIKVKSALEGVTSSLSSIQDGYSTVTNALKEYNENGYLTIDTLNKILTLEPKYLSCLMDENGQLSINKEAYIQLAKAQIEKAKQAVVDEAMTRFNKLAHDELSKSTDEATKSHNSFIEKIKIGINKLSNYLPKLKSFVSTMLGYNKANIVTTYTNGLLNSNLSDEQKKNLQNAYNEASVINEKASKEIISDMNTKLQLIDSFANNIGNSLNDGTGGSSSKDTKETFDWIETAISRLQRTITNFGKTVSSTWESWTNRNSALKSQISAVTSEISKQQQAADKYLSLANSVSLSGTYKELVRNGAMDISTITNENTINAIKQFEEYYEKYLSALDAKQEAQDELASLVRKDFDMIAKQFDSEISLVEANISTLEAYIDQTEMKGNLVSKNYYSDMYTEESKNLALLQDKYDQLSNKLSNGTIKQGSEEFYEMVTEIKEVKQAIIESTTALEEYQKTMRELDWEIFDLIEEKIRNVVEESEFLIDLLSNSKLFNDDGSITSQGQATLGLHVANMKIYESQVKDYAEELEKLDNLFANDSLDQNYLERRQELVELQRDAILNAQNEQQSIKELWSDGYSTLLDYMQQVIDKRLELLNTTKDLYDYEKQVTEQTEEIARLQNILNSYKGDTSEEAKASIQKYSLELSEAEENLAETEREQYLKEQEQMLTNLMDDAEEWQNARLDDVAGLLQDIIGSTDANAETIKTTLEQEVSAVGGQLTTEMANLWSGTDGIKGVVGGVNTTLTEIKNLIQSMVKDSNTEASKNASGATANVTPATKSTTTPNTSNASNNSSTSAKVITVGGMIDAGNAPIYDYAGDTTPERAYFRSQPYYRVLDEKNGYLKVRHQSLSSGTTGWFKKSDVKAYATGGLVDETGLAWLDGTKSKPELVLNSEQTENHLKLTKALETVAKTNMFDAIGNYAKLPNFIPNGNTQNTNGDVIFEHIEIVANNPQEFARQLKDVYDRNVGNVRKMINTDVHSKYGSHNYRRYL